MTATECRRCGQAFEPRKGGRPQRYCSSTCGNRASNAIAYVKHRGLRLLNQRRATYGIGATEYANLLASQGGVCAICRRSESSQRGDRKLTLCVDHDHADGRVRGLLCNRCNRALGGFGDSPEILFAAIAYLARRIEVAS